MSKNKSNKTISFLEQAKQLEDVFPSPSILESYEEVQPGITKELLEMAKAEQKHRQRIEKQIVKSQNYTKRIGQLLVFSLAIIIIYSAISFAVERMFGLAAVTLLSGFGFLTATTFAPLLIMKCKGGVDAKKSFQPKKGARHNSKNYNNRQGNNTGTRRRKVSAK